MSEKLTEIQLKAANHIASINKSGMGAIMPHAELIKAADELNGMGLAEYRPGNERRWLTDAGRAALNEATK